MANVYLILSEKEGIQVSIDGKHLSDIIWERRYIVTYRGKQLSDIIWERRYRYL